jgi:hypothetical protein
MTYFNKTSLLVPSQLPKYISEDPAYANFVAFLQAYYEWMEQQGGAVYGSKNLLSYADIDTTLNEFIQYYMNEFMEFFPQDGETDQRKLLKIIKSIYDTKGTPASYEFLFRVIYGSEVQTYNTKDFILKPSDGKWVITRYVTINSIDPTWVDAIGYILYGTTSKGYATIENVLVYPTYIEVVLTNIQQNFSSGEYVTVVDVHYNPVTFNNETLTGQIFGTLNSVAVNPQYIGQNYNVGDPVVFYGGLNPNVIEPLGATAHISKVSGASVLEIDPVYRGHYENSGLTTLTINSAVGNGAFAVATINTNDTANVYPLKMVITDVVGNKANVLLSSGSYGFSNLVYANANTRIMDALSYPTINTYPISSVKVTSGGANYDATTTANATGFYDTENYNGLPEIQPLASLGILAPIQIINGGAGYNVNDIIVFTEPYFGKGANARITTVDAYGVITGVQYTDYLQNGSYFPAGGMGYQASGLPTISVTSNTGTNASLVIPGIIGSDATFGVQESPSGEVLAITIDNPGRDYISTPGVSLRVEDMLIYNVNILNSPQQGDLIYQGTLTNPTYTVTLDSSYVYSANVANSFYSTYAIRTYDYSGSLDANSAMYVARNGVDIGTQLYVQPTTVGIYTLGRKIYGNGSAKGIANFQNGVVFGKGNYENADGQPSGYSKIQSQEYNNYTYILQVQAALSQYKDTALKFLHPAGMNYVAYNELENDVSFNILMQQETEEIINLQYLLPSNDAYYANVAANSNTISFYNLEGANIANLIQANSFVQYTTNSGDHFYSMVTGSTSNTVTVQDAWISQVPNVAIATANAGSSVINITDMTQAWPIATGNTPVYISDMISVYDTVSFDGVNFYSVSHVDQQGGNTVIVNTTFGSAQSGYLTLSKNTQSSNIFVTGIVFIPELVDIIMEDGTGPLVTEDNRIIILG